MAYHFELLTSDIEDEGSIKIFACFALDITGALYFVLVKSPSKALPDFYSRARVGDSLHIGKKP